MEMPIRDENEESFEQLRNLKTGDKLYSPEYNGDEGKAATDIYYFLHYVPHEDEDGIWAKVITPVGSQRTLNIKYGIFLDPKEGLRKFLDNMTKVTHAIEREYDALIDIHSQHTPYYKGLEEFPKEEWTDEKIQQSVQKSKIAIDAMKNMKQNHPEDFTITGDVNTQTEV
jgi:predicted transposase YbfD/YdcC